MTTADPHLHTHPYDVLALGASAGGYTAVAAVLQALPPDFAVPVVVMQHLAPDALGSAELYRRLLPFAVEQLQPGSALCPGTVLLCPPRTFVDVLPDGTFALAPNERGAVDKPIDRLLASLARSFGHRAIGVILTGMGADGALGARELHGAGGRVIVQNEASAEFPHMPRAAITAGAADLVVPLEDIGPVIAELAAGTPQPQPRSETEAVRRVFGDEGAVAALAATVDWARTELGPVRDWSPALRSVVRLAVDSPYPVALWLGINATLIANEAARPWLGPLFPAGFARPYPQAAPARYADYRQSIARVWTGQWVMQAADGRVIGIHVAWQERTAAVLAARRLQLLNRLAAAETLDNRRAALAGALGMLEDCPDIPFAAAWLLDPRGSQALLAGTAGVAEGDPLAPRQLPARTPGDTWPLQQVLEQGSAMFVEDLPERFPERFGERFGGWHGATPPTAAAICPLHDRAEGRSIGVIVLGTNPRLARDELYENFLTLVDEVEVAVNNSRRLLRLVNSLLDFSQIETRRQEANFEPTDLGALTADIASAFRSAVEAAGIRFRVDCDPHLPPVWVDREMWEKIVSNLLSNAFKFTFGGEIAVELHALKLHAELLVKDTGIGIPEEEMGEIFKRFHRVRGRARSKGRGSGSRSSTTWSNGWPAPAPAAGARLGTILVADDNGDMRSYLRRLLQGRWHVELAPDGAAALAAALDPARDAPPDLILADVMMPGLDGFQLTQRVRAAPQLAATPIILLTARAGEAAAIQGLQAGADDYIAKPFSARELLARIQGVYERGRVQAALRESEERHAFLVRLGDALRPLGDGVQIQETAAQIAMDYYGADRCYYCEVEQDRVIIHRDAARAGLPSVAGVYPLAALPLFTAAAEAGVPIVVADVAASDILDKDLKQLCMGLEIIAYINIPVIKAGRYAGNLCITQAAPRRWTEIEVELAAEMAERTWAAVARARAEAALRAGEGRLRSIMESTTDFAILVLDEEGRFTGWNSGAERIFGYMADEVIGRSAEFLFTPEDRANRVPQREMAQARTTGRAADERWHLRKDGTRFFMSGVMVPLRDGEILGYVKVARDLTESRQAAEALEREVQTRTAQVRALATQLTISEQEERRRISAILHDDLQQRLFSVNMQLATLRRLLGEQGLGAQVMDDAGRMIGEMSEALRDAVQVMRSLSVSLSPPVLHDEGLYEAVRWLASLMQQQHGLSVAVTAAGPLPQLGEDLRVLIFQTIRELLFNVAKHAGVAEAAVAMAAGEGQLRVEVSDAGRGFDAAEAAAEGNSEAGGAAGGDAGSQGLLWAQRRLQLLGGRVEVQSQPGEGTRVTIVVPAAAA